MPQVMPQKKPICATTDLFCVFKHTYDHVPSRTDRVYIKKKIKKRPLFTAV